MAEQSRGIKMLRIEQVAEKVGYKESTIYDWMNPRSPRHKSHFPLPRKNGRSNRWFESEIDDFCILEFGGSSACSAIQANRAANSRDPNPIVSMAPMKQILGIATSSEKSAPTNKNAKTLEGESAVRKDENDYAACLSRQPIHPSSTTSESVASTTKCSTDSIPSRVPATDFDKPVPSTSIARVSNNRLTTGTQTDAYGNVRTVQFEMARKTRRYSVLPTKENKE